jgi:hypothetical protein
MSFRGPVLPEESLFDPKQTTERSLAALGMTERSLL